MRKEVVTTHSSLILRTQVKRRSLQARVPRKRRGPKDGLISGGIQYSTTMCTLGSDQGGSAHHCRQEPWAQQADGGYTSWLDSFGVFACGEFWPLVAWGSLAILLIITGLALLYLLLVFCRPCWSLCQCCRRQIRAVANEVGELQHRASQPYSGAGGKEDLRAPRKFLEEVQNLLGSNHPLKVGPPSTHGRFRKNQFFLKLQPLHKFGSSVMMTKNSYMLKWKAMFQIYHGTLLQ